MIKDLAPTVLRLMAARLARSIAQGALVTDFALYARTLGWSATRLGLVFALAIGFSVVLTAGIGPASDRFGRRQFLLVYEILSVATSIIALESRIFLPLAVAAIIGGFGRGANGAAGPFAPAEQSWMSVLIAPKQLGALLSLNASLGFFGMAVGAVVAGLIGPVQPIFWLPLGAGLIAFSLLWLSPDPQRLVERFTGPAQQAEAATARVERGLLWRLAGLNLLNGTGIGMVGPFMSWWFAARFGVGAGAIGPSFALGFIAAGSASMVAGRLTPRYGAVRTVVVMRALGLASLVAMPFMPSFAAAVLVYTLRSALNRGTAGARQAVALGLVRGKRRGLAASINTLSTMAPRGIAPAFAGALFAEGALVAPFLIAGLFQGAYLVLYPLAFSNHDQSRP
ncbi:MFS transporter [Acidiphilium sp. MT5]